VQDKAMYPSTGTEKIRMTNEKSAPAPALDQQAKAEFAAEMNQLGERMAALPSNNVIKFKVTLDSEVDQTVARISPLLVPDQRSDFANEMAQIKNRIYSNPKLNVEKAKYELSNDLAQLTAKYVSKVDGRTTLQAAGPGTSSAGKLTGAEAKNPAAAPEGPPETPAAAKPAAPVIGYAPSPAVLRTAKPITPETYTGIMNDLMAVGDGKQTKTNQVKIDGNVRYHYAVNSGSASWGQNTSGLRARIGAELWLNPDWRFNAMVEGNQNILNYENSVNFRASLTGKIRGATLQAGSFGYFMADGNIYDSTFNGGRLDFGGPIKYTLALGSTDFTQQTLIATARHEALDYTVEAGVYNYLPNGTGQKNNTIFNLAGNYKFSNFSVGSMILLASQKDSQGNNFGYVHSINYGELKTWRPGTYALFARYYNQPRYTYISPSMNGRGGWMQGYRGFGIGVYYTLAQNLVGGLEYYNLREFTTGTPGATWWGSLTSFF